MAAPNLKAFASALKGRVTRKTTCLIATNNPSNVADNAAVKVTGTDGVTSYEWTGAVKSEGNKQKGLKVTLNCDTGNATALAAKPFIDVGDIIDVEVTVTNPGGEFGSVNGIVSIE